MHDSGTGDSQFRVVMFGTLNFFRLLINKASTPIVFSDGTWKACPPPFTQLYTFHGFSELKSIPLVFCLIKGKEKKTYEYILDQMKNLALTMFEVPITFEPERWTIDFEQAMIGAIKSRFPRCKVHCCSFHFGQSFLKAIKRFELFSKYQDETCRDFQIHFQVLKAIQYVEEEFVKDTFKHMITTNYFFEECLNLTLIEKTNVQRVSNICLASQAGARLSCEWP